MKKPHLSSEDTQQIRALRSIEQVDRHIARIGEQNATRSLVETYASLTDRSPTPLLVYGYCRAIWEDGYSYTRSDIQSFYARGKAVRNLLQKVKVAHATTRELLAAEILFWVVYRFEHPKIRYSKTITPALDGPGSAIVIRDNLAEILLPMIEQYEKLDSLHPAIVYLKTGFLIQSGLGMDDAAKIYVLLYEKNQLDRLPLEIRMEILFSIYLFYSRQRNADKEKDIQDEIIRLMDKTWSHPVIPEFAAQALTRLEARHRSLRNAIEALRRRKEK